MRAGTYWRVLLRASNKHISWIDKKRSMMPILSFETAQSWRKKAEGNTMCHRQNHGVMFPEELHLLVFMRILIAARSSHATHWSFGFLPPGCGCGHRIKQGSKIGVPRNKCFVLEIGSK
jgi:hypothetical protein